MIHLNRYYHFTELMRDPRIEMRLTRYDSKFDGSPLSLLELTPNGIEPRGTVFFFHGMDGDVGDAVVIRKVVSDLKLKVIALGGRGPCWLSSSFCRDAPQLISDSAVNNFYLMGVSMGGTQALSLAALLPPTLHSSLLGVIALIPGGDLGQILEKSRHDRVRETIFRSLNGDPTQLKKTSPSHLLDHYPSVPTAIFYNEEDITLPVEGLKKLIKDLRDQGHPVSTFVAPGDHCFTYEKFDFARIFNSLGKNETHSIETLI